MDESPLAVIRVSKRISQSDLAEQVGVSQPRISQIENSPGHLNYKLAMRIADVLNCEVRDLVGESKEAYLAMIQKEAEQLSGSDLIKVLDYIRLFKLGRK